MNNFIKIVTILIIACCTLLSCNSYENDTANSDALIVQGFYSDRQIHHAGESVNVYVVMQGNPPEPIKYQYEFVTSSGTIATNGASAKITLATTGIAVIKATVTDGKGRIASKTLPLMGQNKTPVIKSFKASSYTINKDTSTTLTVVATDPDNDLLNYTYTLSTNQGTISNGMATATYTAGKIFGGTNIITVTVKDGSGAEVTASLSIKTTRSTVILGGLLGAVGIGLSTAWDIAVTKNNDAIIVKQSGSSLIYYSLPLSPRFMSNADVSNMYTISVGEAFTTPKLRIHNNIMYTAYKTSSSRELCLKKYDGSSWETITTGCINITNFSFELDSNGIPHFAFKDPLTSGANYSVIRYNGTSWDLVGSRGIFPAYTFTVRNPILFFDGSQYPVVTTQISNYVAVTRYNGSSWVISATNLGSVGSYPTEGATASNGDLYISMSGSYGDNGILLYNGSSWSRDLENITTDQTRGTGVKITPNGTVWAFAYIPYNNINRTWVKRPGGSWGEYSTIPVSAVASPVAKHMVDYNNNHYSIDVATNFMIFSYQ